MLRLKMWVLLLIPTVAVLPSLRSPATALRVKAGLRQSLYDQSPKLLVLVQSLRCRLKTGMARMRFVHRPTDPAKIDVARQPFV